MEKFNFEFKSFKEQVEIFENRGMIIEDKNKAINTLKFINYYKLKESSLVFFINGKYENITFNELLNRFYETKNLRLDILRITEKIELFLKTQFSYVLSRNRSNDSAFSYLNFNEWVDNAKYCKYYINYKEADFKKRIDISIRKSQNNLLKEYSNNKIPIWILMDVLTFGEVLDLYRLLNFKDQREVSNNLNLKFPIFISWLETINLIRNLSAHNANIIDLILKTQPKLIKDFYPKLHGFSNFKVNKIATVILILEYLVFSINKDYRGGAVRKRLIKLCKNKTDEEAQILGFNSFDIIKKLKI